MAELEKISAALICNHLHAQFSGNCRYKVANAYIFGWESDFFVQKQNGYAYEFEVKISRSDFFKDKQKYNKHSVLYKGKYSQSWTTHQQNSQTNQVETITKTQEITPRLKPNKFYYVVPTGMVDVKEVPHYAGLYYFGATECGQYYELKKVKEAPFLHKDKLNFEAVLCNKFYTYWLQTRQELKSVKGMIDYWRKKYEELQQNHSHEQHDSTYPYPHAEPAVSGNAGQ